MCSALKKAVQETYKNINNAVINAAPKDMIVNTHVCRGNFHSTYASSGAYDSSLCQGAG